MTSPATRHALPMPLHRPLRHDVAVVGLGYAGLPTALALHAAGRTVLGLDLSQQRLDEIRVGAVDLLPEDHSRLLHALDSGDAFRLTSSPAALVGTQATLICVPTPTDRHLTPDLTALRAACRTAVDHATGGQLLVLTSTTYVGCTREFLVEPLRQRGFEVGRDVFVAYAPDRLDPGTEHHTRKAVPRVVGGATAECTRRAADLLDGCASYLHPVGSPEAAELTKLYENTFRAVNIGLANEFADIARTLGLPVTEIIDAAATKPYGFLPFHPGPGAGGHGTPSDPHYLLWQLRATRTGAPVIESAMSAIAARPARVAHRVLETLAARGIPPTRAQILILGVAYKPGVADARASPALEIIDRLRRAGASVSFTDDLVPHISVRGSRMHSVNPVNPADWDAVLAHTLHPTTDHSWLPQTPTIIDATYRLTALPQTVTI